MSTFVCRTQNEESVSCLLGVPWAKKRKSKQGRRSGKQPAPLPLSSCRDSHSDIFINTHPLFSSTSSLLVVMVTKMARIELKEDQCSEMYQALVYNLITPIQWLIITQQACIFTPSLCKETINIHVKSHSDQIFTPRKMLITLQQIQRKTNKERCQKQLLYIYMSSWTMQEK